MIQSIERAAIVEGLLNSLESERHVRRALLLDVIDEIAACPLFEAAAGRARALLRRVDARDIADVEFAHQVATLRQEVRVASLPLSRTSSPHRAATAA